MTVELERRSFTSFDGTRLAYYVAGPEQAPALVISAGLGGGIRGWARLIERLAGTMRIVAWDYRGLYRSDAPTDRGSYTMAHHAGDLAALLDHEGIVHPVLAGWSMGVQVNFELHRIHGHAPRAIIALHGATGYPLDTAFEGRGVHQISPTVFNLMRRFGRQLMRPAPRVASSRRVALSFMKLCQRYSIMDEAADPDVFHDMARDWVRLDLAAYADIFERLGEHDAGDVLHKVSAPTLVVGGGKDRFTPLHLSRDMVAKIAEAELYVLPNATHFGPIEYPDRIADRVERFLRERTTVFADESTAKRSSL